MAYTANDLILNDHYNIFVSGSAGVGTTDHGVANLGTLWGAGSADKGYGQTTGPLVDVAPETVVTATQWATLLARTTAIAAHQGTIIPAADPTHPLPPTVSATIYALDEVQGNIVLVDTAAATQDAAVVPGTDSESDIANDATGWALTSTHTQTLQFASADAARYFFNAGGYIDMTFERPIVGGETTKEVEWSTLMSEAGTIRISAHATAQVGGTGTGSILVATNYGYYEATGIAFEIYREFPGGSVYGTNKINVTLQTNGVQGLNLDNGDEITFVTEFYDPGLVDDPITGDMRVTCTIQYPDDAQLVDNSWSFGGGNTFPVSSVVQV